MTFHSGSRDLQKEYFIYFKFIPHFINVSFRCGLERKIKRGRYREREREKKARCLDCGSFGRDFRRWIGFLSSRFLLRAAI